MLSWPLVLIVLLGSPLAGLGSDSAQPVGAERASTQHAEPPETWREELVVTATRSAITAGEVPVATRVLRRDEIERSPDPSLLELVEFDTSMGSSASHSSLVAIPRDQSFSFRGLGGGNTSRGLLLVDGFPVMDPYNSSAIWTLVPKSLVDRVEIVRGGGSTVWGNLALTGVVNLLTRPASANALAASLRIAERETLQTSVSYSDVGDRWSGWLGVSTLDTDGYHLLTPEARGPVDEPYRKDTRALVGRLSRQLRESATLYVTARGGRETLVEGLALERATVDDRFLGLSSDLSPTSRDTVHLRLFGRSLELDGQNGDENDARTELVPRSELELPTLSLGLGATWSLRRGAHLWAVGADVLEQEIERRERLELEGGSFQQLYTVEGRQRLGGLYAEDLWSEGRWTLQVGARADTLRTYDARSSVRSLVSGETTSADAFEDNTESTVSPRLGLVYELSPSSRLRASAYTGFRAPLPNEMWVASAPTRGRFNAVNPGLLPETMVGAEAGWDLTLGSRFSAHTTAFWGEVDDLIQRVVVARAGAEPEVIEPCGLVTAGGQCRQRRNLGSIRSRGLELELELRPSPSWAVGLAATLQDSEVIENPPDPTLVGNQVQNAPEERYGGFLRFTGERGLAGQLRLRYVGSRFDDVENDEPLESAFVADLAATFALNPRWSLFAGVENLFDEEHIVNYRAGLLERGLPRMVHAGVRLRR